jgi:hypothetical protein
MTKAICQQGAALLLVGMSLEDICEPAGMSEMFVFKVKQFLRDGNNLKPFRSASPKAVAPIRCIPAALARDLHESIWKLAAKHKMLVNLMKCIVSISNDYGHHSRVAQISPAWQSMSVKRRLRTEFSGKVIIFSDEKLFITDAQVNRQKISYPTDLPMSDVDKNIRVSPFSKVPAKVKVLESWRALTKCVRSFSRWWRSHRWVSHELLRQS